MKRFNVAILGAIFVAMTSPAAEQPDRLSLRDAKSIALNNYLIDFLPGGVVMGPDPAKILTCRYEDLDPRVVHVDGRSVVDFGSQCKLRLGIDKGESEAQQLASALLRWKNSSAEERQRWQAVDKRSFDLLSDDYRNAAQKPELPEETRRLKILAEVAAKEKRYADAARAYQFAVINTPWWPEGHFNAAILLAELHHYEAAVAQMRQYLALKPEAKDARSAQDKIYEWGGAVITPPAVVPTHVRLGVQFQMLTRSQADALHKPELHAVLVVVVGKGSVAEISGIVKDDVILRYGDKLIADEPDLSEAILATKRGEKVLLTIMRGSQEQIVTVQF